MSTDTYTVGFVSSPHPHSAYHVKTLDVLDEVQAIHLCGLAGEDTDTLAAQSSKVASKSGSVEEMLARGQLDAMMVSVRNDLCPGVLEAAAAAGVPVLFEKPGALRASDLRRIADMGRDKGVTMGAMYQNRWSPMNQEVRRIVQAGALGRVMSAESRMVTSQVQHRDPSHWLFGRATGGSGILSWLACHHIDMLCYIMDDRIVEVAAMVGNQNREKVEVEDTAMLTLRFRSGVLGTLHSGYHLTPSRDGYAGGSSDSFMAFRGQDGHIRMPGGAATLQTVASGWAAEGKREFSFESAQSEAYGGLAGEDFVSDFLKASRTGAPAPAPIEDAVHVLDVVEAALESSETGRVVKIGG